MKPTERKPKHSVPGGRKRLPRTRRSPVHVDLASLLSIDHVCGGCDEGDPCCCATYEVCVNAAELNQIIEVLPEAAKLCPHLSVDEGYDNVFDEVEPGLFAIDTTEDGLCVLAFHSDQKTRCSLHAVALTLGLPLGKVKPKACLLWPMSCSEGEEHLSLSDDALSFKCNVEKGRRSRHLSSSLVEAIKLVYGEGFGKQLEKEAAQGVRRTR